MRLRWGGCTDKGRVRRLNEDAFSCQPELGLFVVCDGMGGHAAGEVASRLAVETIVNHLRGPETPGEGPGSENPRGFLPRTQRLGSALRLSNQSIHEESRKDSQRAGMGSTAVCAWLGDNIASLAHVGDSRAYLWRKGQLEQLTRDHSLVEAQVQAGLITPSERQQAEQQNILLRALGPQAEVEVELAEVPLRPGDRLLLCSDGLTRMVDETGLAEALARVREAEKICPHLVELANRNGGVDNVTVVVVEIGSNNPWSRLWRGWRR